MKKLLLVVMASVSLACLASTSQAALRLDVEQGYNFFNDDRIEGQNRHLGFAFDITDDVEAGFYIEKADLQVTGDVGATPPNTTKLNTTYQAIRIVKNINSWLSAGVDLGSVKVQQGATSGAFAATAALNQNKPYVGLLGKLRRTTELKKDTIATEMNLTLGYRFADLSDTAITGAPVGESTLDDLNALIVGVGFGLKF